MKAILVLGLLVPGVSLACGPKGTTTASVTTAATEAPTAENAAIDPAHCAKSASLVGNNCSFSTGMMAQRVLEEGTSWSFTGVLTAATNELASHVAAPYAVGPRNEIQVVANEVVESLATQAGQGERVVLEGKILEVDGVKYFVAMKAKTPNT